MIGNLPNVAHILESEREGASDGAAEQGALGVDILGHFVRRWETRRQAASFCYSEKQKLLLSSVEASESSNSVSADFRVPCTLR